MPSFWTNHESWEDAESAFPPIAGLLVINSRIINDILPQRTQPKGQQEQISAHKSVNFKAGKEKMDSC